MLPAFRKNVLQNKNRPITGGLRIFWFIKFNQKLLGAQMSKNIPSVSRKIGGKKGKLFVLCRWGVSNKNNLKTRVALSQVANS